MAEPVRIPSLLVALGLVNAIFVSPRWLAAGRVGPPWLALEACLVIGLLVLLPTRRWTTPFAATLACASVILSLVAFADAVLRGSLGRPLNLYLDVRLLRSVGALLTGTFGAMLGVAIAVGFMACVALATWLFARLLVSLAVRGPGRVERVAGGVLVAVSVAGVAGAWPAVSLAPAPTVVRVARDQTRQFGRMMAESDRFAVELRAIPASYATLDGLLEGLRGRDVMLAFVESYGMSAVDDPRYAPIVRSRLGELDSRLARAGLHVATGTLVSPTQGGQSWLAHGSVLGGAWLDNQLRYDAWLASGRETLIDDFRRAGHRTVAVVPAITLAWPEGERLGYDRILARRDIDYAGPALNWVTMPDQFTWSFVERAVRATATAQDPIFVEISLISSHAPWTPILPVLDDWESIGDGAVFAPWEHAGERPEDLWLDTTRVQEHYARSVDYAINAMVGYAERYVTDRALLIVLGDHQAAPLITGEDAVRAVPVHVISGDPALVQPFLDWGFHPGAFPDPDQRARRMDDFRGWFIRAYSVPAAVSPTAAARAQ